MPEVYTAIITPFTSDNKIDFESLEKLINHQVENKIDGIVLFGTTGESPTLSLDEKLIIFDFVSKLDLKQTKLIIGFGGNNTFEIIEEMKYFDFSNVETFMLSTPYYNKQTQEGLYQHFTTILKTFINKSFLLYNIPSRTGVNLLPETIQRIYLSCPNIFGVKEASGDLSQIEKLINLIPTLNIYSGDDNLYFQVMELGGCGVVSVLSNLYPKEMKEMDSKILDYVPYLFIETNPSPIKFIMYQNKLIKSDLVRLPLVTVSEENQEKILDFIKSKQKEIQV
jgi:4-hydroxy-tetrahydrodipicolinate synthase